MTAAQQTALEVAVSITGAGEAERPVLEQLCLARDAWWRARLLPGVTEDDCGTALCCAVALTAAADLSAVRSGGLAGFTVGELSVQCGSSGDAAARRAAEELMAPYARPADFSFRRVRG